MTRLIKISDQKEVCDLVSYMNKNTIEYQQTTEFILVDDMTKITKYLSRQDMSYEIFSIESVFTKIKKTNFDKIVDIIKASVKIHMDKWVSDVFKTWQESLKNYEKYTVGYMVENNIATNERNILFYDKNYMTKWDYLAKMEGWSKGAIKLCAQFTNEQTLVELRKEASRKLEKINVAVRKKLGTDVDVIADAIALDVNPNNKESEIEGSWNLTLKDGTVKLFKYRTIYAEGWIQRLHVRTLYTYK